MIRCESQQNSNTKLRWDTPRSLPQLRQPKLHPAALPTSPPRPSSPHNLRQLRPKLCWARSSAAARIQLHAITHFIKRGCVWGGEIKTKQKGITASLKFYWERSRQLIPNMPPTHLINRDRHTDKTGREAWICWPKVQSKQKGCMR